MSSFYDRFFAEPMAERLRIAEAAGLSLAYIHKHTYVQKREPKFHFHNAVALDRASNAKLCMLDITEGDIDWGYVLERLKVLNKAGRIRRRRIVAIPTALFLQFWEVYPRKVNKGAALNTWRQMGLDIVGELVVEHAKRDMAAGGWEADPAHLAPTPVEWLRLKRWAFDPSKLPPKKSTKTLKEA